MYGRKCLLTLALTVLAVSVFPGTSSAQLIGRGRGYGGGYYGGGYGGGFYGPGYYNSGVSVGLGRGVGYGYPYGGGYGLGYGGQYGSPYHSYGYTTTGGYYSSPSVGYNQPSTINGTTSYHSMYMPQGVDAGCGCGCVGGAPSGTTTVGATTTAATGGRGTIMVNVPANAEVTWNGSRSVAFGPVRYYTTLPISNGATTQKFEARWTGSDGQTITRTREIEARPNETVTIDFNSETNSATNGAPQTDATPVNRPNDAPGINGDRKDQP